MEKEEYFTDDCIVESELYLKLKDLLICPICKKLYKDPLMCSGCQSTYCQKCIGTYIKKNTCPKNCKNIKFSKSISKNELLSKLKYKCKNCKEEVIQSNIKAHLESNCEKKEERTRTLGEIYQKKKELVKLTPAEMSKIDKDKINHFTSKKYIIFLIIIIFY
jgi:hypothetical protein